MQRLQEHPNRYKAKIVGTKYGINETEKNLDSLKTSFVERHKTCIHRYLEGFDMRSCYCQNHITGMLHALIYERKKRGGCGRHLHFGLLEAIKD